jgi:hypothetical protein
MTVVVVRALFDLCRAAAADSDAEPRIENSKNSKTQQSKLVIRYA